jgi:hypothetical protein
VHWYCPTFHFHPQKLWAKQTSFKNKVPSLRYLVAAIENRLRQTVIIYLISMTLDLCLGYLHSPGPFYTFQSWAQLQLNERAWSLESGRPESKSSQTTITTSCVVWANCPLWTCMQILTCALDSIHSSEWMQGGLSHCVWGACHPVMFNRHPVPFLFWPNGWWQLIFYDHSSHLLLQSMSCIVTGLKLIATMTPFFPILFLIKKSGK